MIITFNFEVVVENDGDKVHEGLFSEWIEQTVGEMPHSEVIENIEQWLPLLDELNPFWEIKDPNTGKWVVRKI